MIEINANPRAGLFIAHPSHELRLHGWLQRARPRVSVLTDGSGRSGQSRLPSTTRVLDEVGAEAGGVYGRLTDLEVYAALLNKDSDLFVGLAEEIAAELISEQIEYVVGDAAEGYSSAHDVCRLVLNAAVELANRRTNRQIANLDFNVLGLPDECPERHRDAAVRLHLDDQAFSHKVAAAHSYNPKLAADIEAALKGELFQGIKHFSEPEIAGEVDVGPMVTSADLERLRNLNFGHRALQHPFEPDVLLREIARYNPQDAVAVSERIRAMSGRDLMISTILEMYEEVLDEYSSTGPPDTELEAHAAAEFLRWLTLNFQHEQEVLLNGFLSSTTIRVRNRLLRVPVLGSLALAVTGLVSRRVDRPSR